MFNAASNCRIHKHRLLDTSADAGFPVCMAAGVSEPETDETAEPTCFIGPDKGAGRRGFPFPNVLRLRTDLEALLLCGVCMFFTCLGGNVQGSKAAVQRK